MKTTTGTQSIIIQWAIDVLKSPLADFVIKLAIAAGVFVIGWFIIVFVVGKIKKRILDNVIDDQNEYQQKVADLVGDIVFNILMVFNILIGFEILWFSVSVLMAWISFGVGFAMQQILWNMMAGIMLITNKKFHIGDIVQILWGIKVFGKIEALNIRYTIVRTFDKRRVIIPNLELISVPIKTYSAEEFIKNELEFSCYFTTDLQRAKQTITAIINSNPYVVFKENTTVSTTEFYHSGIILKAYFYTSPKIKSAFFVKNQIKMMVNDVYKSGQAGLDRAYPHIAYTVDANDTNLLWSIKRLADQTKKIQ